MGIIDTEVMDYIINLYKDEDTRRYKQPYKYRSVQGEKKAIQTEIDTVYYHISRFVSESDDYNLLVETEEALKIIKKQYEYGMKDDAKLNITILSIFLELKPGFPNQFSNIKKIVAKQPITIENLVKIIKTPKFNDMGRR